MSQNFIKNEIDDNKLENKTISNNSMDYKLNN